MTPSLRGAASAALPADRRWIAGLVASRDPSGVASLVIPGVDGVAPSKFVGAWLSRDASRALAQVLRGVRDNRSWRAWAEASHVLTGIDDELGLTDLERALERDLAALVAVCRAPRLLLRPEEERSPVARARRVAPRTVIDLLGRPADWERRTLHGIDPARVLSVVTEDDWDLYENRVAARLVDRLLEILAARLEHLEKIYVLLGDVARFSNELKHSHWRKKRLERVWERFVHDDHIRQRAEQTLGVVRRAHDVLRSLTASPLYQHIARNVQLEGALRPTNILTNDPNYRRVASLWRAATAARDPEDVSAKSLARARRDDASHFDDYGRLLVMQALSARGYRPARDDTACDAPVDLRGPRGALTLRRGVDGATSLAAADETLTVVSLPVRLAAEDLRAFTETLTAARKLSPGTATLYLAHGSPREILDATDDPALRRFVSGWGDPRVLFVSPASLDAVERVGRVVEQWDVAARLRAYPPRRPLRDVSPATKIDDLDRAQDDLALKTPLRAKGLEALSRDVDATLAKAEASQREAARARRPFDTAQFVRLQTLRALLDEAGRFAWLTVCPVCGGENTAFETRFQGSQPAAEQTFFARCGSCNASWGLARCGGCGGRFATLDPGLSLPCPDDAAELDAVYGRDLWTVLSDGAPRCGAPGCDRSIDCG